MPLLPEEMPLPARAPSGTSVPGKEFCFCFIIFVEN